MSYVHTILRQMACFMTSVVCLSGYVRVANYWIGYWQSKISKFLYFMKNVIDYLFFFLSSYFKFLGGAWEYGTLVSLHMYFHPIMRFQAHFGSEYHLKIVLSCILSLDIFACCVGHVCK